MEEWLKANEYEGVCTSYVLVSHLHTVDSDDELSSYPIAFMQGSIPFHVSVGLLTVGLDIARGLGRWSRIDDEED